MLKISHAICISSILVSLTACSNNGSAPPSIDPVTAERAIIAGLDLVAIGYSEACQGKTSKFCSHVAEVMRAQAIMDQAAASGALDAMAAAVADLRNALAARDKDIGK